MTHKDHAGERHHRIEQFKKLDEEGWDSYGARPVDPRAVKAAQQANELMALAFVSPLVDGGVGFEEGGTLLPEQFGFGLDFKPDGTLANFYLKLPTGEWEHSWEDES